MIYVWRMIVVVVQPATSTFLYPRRLLLREVKCHENVRRRERVRERGSNSISFEMKNASRRGHLARWNSIATGAQRTRRNTSTTVPYFNVLLFFLFINIYMEMHQHNILHFLVCFYFLWWLFNSSSSNLSVFFSSKNKRERLRKIDASSAAATCGILERDSFGKKKENE